MKTKYYISDARKIDVVISRAKIPLVDLIITSPPYFDMKNYCDLRGQIGIGQTYEQFLVDIASIFQTCYKLSNESATLWMVVDTLRKSGEMKSLPFDIANSMKDKYGKDTWILKDVIIWDKCKNIPWQFKGRFKNMFEYILFFSKGSKYKYNIDRVREIADYKKWWLTYPERYNANGKAPENIWHYPIPIRGWGNGCQNHLCPFPFALVERILALASDPGDFVVDPFAGSGSVMAMAHVMGRNAIGLDVNSDFKKRYNKEVLPGARKYWEKRKTEIDLIETRKRRFKRLNLKLRKIKCAVLFREILFEDEWKIARVIMLSEQGSRNKIKIFVLGLDGLHNPEIVSSINEHITTLMTRFKLNISLKFTSPVQIRTDIRTTHTLYGYSPHSIYKYSNKMKVDELLISHDDGLVYSNMEINLNKSASVLDLLKS